VLTGWYIELENGRIMISPRRELSLTIVYGNTFERY